MNLRATIFGSILALAAAPAVLHAGDPQDEHGYIGVLASHFLANDLRQGDGNFPGGMILYGMPLDDFPHWNLEFGLGYNSTDSDFTGDTDTITSLGFDMRRHWRDGKSVQPFVLAGAALSLERFAGDNSEHATVDLGAGLLFPLGSGRTALRLEGRTLVQKNDIKFGGQQLSGRYLMLDGLVSLGLHIGFGGAGKAPQREARPVQVVSTEKVPSVGDIYALEGVQFGFDEAWLTPASHAVLRDVAVRLNSELSGYRVRIDGFTDTSGPESYNYDLSKRRAESVRRFLVDSGVSGDRLETRGHGPEMPIADNGTRFGRAANRRVELTVLGRD